MCVLLWVTLSLIYSLRVLIILWPKRRCTLPFAGNNVNAEKDLEGHRCWLLIGFCSSFWILFVFLLLFVPNWKEYNILFPESASVNTTSLNRNQIMNTIDQLLRTKQKEKCQWEHFFYLITYFCGFITLDTF